MTWTWTGWAVSVVLGEGLGTSGSSPSSPGWVEGDIVAVAAANGEALDSTGGLKNWYTELAMLGTKSGSVKTAGTL